jgi:hypothetical protein
MHRGQHRTEDVQRMEAILLSLSLSLSLSLPNSLGGGQVCRHHARMDFRLFEIYTDLIKSNQPSTTRGRNWPELITKHLIIRI